MALLLPIIVFVGMYFLILRPQQKRMKEREALVRAAGVGDEVATVGGVIGIIVAEEDENVVSLEVDDDVELRVQRRSIGEIVTKAEQAADASDNADDGDGDGADDDD